MSECVALLRGINVGRAKRVAMADLRKLLESLDCTQVRTLLNSGNAIFQAPGGSTRRLATVIEEAIQQRFGFPVPVLIHTARELGEIIAENSQTQAEQDPSKFLVAFVASRSALGKAKPLLAGSWGSERLAIGSRAAYLWCATGILQSRLLPVFSRAMGTSITTRNWATVLKLQAVISTSR
ncbi:MAG TPA: DUF1697 domain-containing protein [Steroidobacteraceae bacterium]|jgi:uncharacterized protein (DUF1697 family)